ncbi:hypothetical protein HN587_01975 [Candidatus Woesearchaeota archaeon]|jgi:molybdopterin/thiamine biosynthesis adenylyltransferase|nr:hypothetical protein [Candidatus Woesearchaeota archaeon]
MANNQEARLDRFLRGVGPEGFKKLENSVVTVVMDSPVGMWYAFPFAASGIPLRMISTAQIEPPPEDFEGLKENFIGIDLAQGNLAHAYAKAFRKFNGDNIPANKIASLNANLGFNGTDMLLFASSVVIDCTTSLQSKKIALKYARETNSTLISSAVVPGYSKAALWHPELDGASIEQALMPEMSLLEQQTLEMFGIETSNGLQLSPNAQVTRELISMVMGGLVAEEAVRAILTDIPDKSEELLQTPLHYKFGHNSEIFHPLYSGDELFVLECEDFLEKAALLYGAGSIGNMTGYSLVKMGFGRIANLDSDIIESTNIHRTILFYGMEGKRKTHSLAKRLSAISGGATKTKAIMKKLKEEGWDPEEPYDVYVDGFDNFAARMLVSQQGLKDDVVVASLSGRFDGFNADLYVPNHTICLDCNIGINEKGESDRAKQRQSCGREITPQNTWMNQSVGALGALQIASALYPGKYGTPFNGMIFHDRHQKSRLFANEKEGTCQQGHNGEITHYDR